MSKVLCIYHGNCADGFGAAWAVRQAFGGVMRNVEFHAGHYGAPPPDVTDRRVLIVDFSYKRPVLDEMAKVAQSILILDHHKTAAAELAGLPEPPFKHDPESHWAVPVRGVHAIFDMDRSGARITWDYFHGTEPPELIKVIEDRDLWRFALPYTRELMTAIFSHRYDFSVWDRLASALENPEGRAQLIAEGEAIDRKHFKDITELLNVCERTMEIGGHTVPVASLPYTMSSDAANAMANGRPFAACYMDTEKGRVFSLRSKDDGLDVSEIAKSYGGGGHARAAGFEVPRDHALATA